MSKFSLQFTCDNAAFDDDGGSFEIERILRDVAAKVTSGSTEGLVYDVNGNRVGEWRLTKRRV